MGWSAKAANRRRIIYALVPVIGLAVVLSRGGSLPGAPERDSARDRRRWSIAEGLPVCVGPAGPQDGRPRVVRGLLPSGSSMVRVLFVDDAGHCILEREVTRDTPGCVIEDGSFDRGAHEYRAASLLMPFPPESELALSTGQRYGVTLAVAGARAGGSSVFQILDTGN